MEYFKSLTSVLSAPQPGEQPSGSEIVERLVNRVQSSTLLEDRRDACRALKALSRKYRVEVGAQGMDAIVQVLNLDRSDLEIVSFCLDILCNVVSKEIFDEEQEHVNNVNVGEQFTEMLIKNPDNVSLVLSFLEEYEFRVRWPSIKLLTSLLANKPKDIQEIVLVSPMGVSKLIDLLSDQREVIRNDALLLIIQLTKGNANIQKIVAFENAFDKLFDVIQEEGGIDGGIVVEDCLLLMLNLLKNNSSNQNFFKEGSYIQKLASMFNITQDQEDGWSPQKITNIHVCLSVIRTLVSPGNPLQIISSCQKIIRNCGVLEGLCNILMASGVPADILTETINTMGDVIRGSLTNQEYFATVMAPSNPPRPALIILLMSMVNEKQPFSLRCAVLYCFQCFLYKNEIGQSQIVQTLLPANNSASNQSLTMGQLLCSGMFSGESLSCWFSSVALSHTLIDNVAQKEQLLRVLLATNIASTPVSFLQQCTALLQQGTKLQSKLGLLQLLATWLAHCPLGVKQFLNIPGSMAYLTAQTSSTDEQDDDVGDLLQGMCAFLMGICLSFNDDSVHTYTIENLLQLIEKRVGIDVFITKLTEVSKHEAYNRASKQPQIKFMDKSHSNRNPADLLLLDHEFCRLFKSLEGTIVKNVTRGINSNANENHLTEFSLSTQENGLLLQYKELIREQDRKLHALQTTVNTLSKEKEELEQNDWPDVFSNY